MTNLEGRLIRLELLLKHDEQRLSSLESRAATLEQQGRQPLAQMWQAGGGGGGPVFIALTGAGGIAAASGAPAGGTPGSASLSIYQLVGGSYTSMGTATVYNCYLSATAASVKVLTVGTNGDGTYTVLGESCT